MHGDSGIEPLQPENSTRERRKRSGRNAAWSQASGSNRASAAYETAEDASPHACNVGGELAPLAEECLSLGQTTVLLCDLGLRRFGQALAGLLDTCSAVADRGHGEELTAVCRFDPTAM